MKNRLMRPAAALFPLTLLAADLLGGEMNAAMILLFYFALQLCSLCAVDCFCNAAARQSGPRRVDKLFFGSFPMIILSASAVAWLFMQFNDVNNNFIIPIGISLGIIIEQLFEERLYTLNHRADGNLLAVISNALLFAGLMLDGMGNLPSPVKLFYTLAASGASMLISILTSLVIAPPRGFSLIPRSLLSAPKAVVQGLLFPAAWFALFAVNRDFDKTGVGLLSALAMWRLSRTVCRRSADESRPLSLLLMFITGALIVGACWFDVLVTPSFCCWMALACAMIVFLRPSWRNIVGTLLLTGAFALKYFEIGHFYHNLPVIGCCLPAVILNLRRAFLRKV